jgi:hypothetical protein
MGNLFSSGGISEDDCGNKTVGGNDYTHMKWDGSSCVHKANSCGISEWYNMASKECESNLVDSSTIVVAECDETTCPPAQTLDIATLKLPGDVINGGMQACNQSTQYWDSSKEIGNKCVNCSSGSLNKDDPFNPFCECTTDKELVGDECLPKCAPGQLRLSDNTCACPSGTKDVFDGSDFETAVGCASTDAFTNPLTGKKMTDKEKLMLLVLVLILLYMYNPKFKAFVNRSTRGVVRRRR